jgi:hypothetical protein
VETDWSRKAQTGMGSIVIFAVGSFLILTACFNKCLKLSEEASGIAVVTLRGMTNVMLYKTCLRFAPARAVGLLINFRNKNI